MGCSQSKIENEESVSRCKDRKRYMRDAVSSRNAFAAAHSAYIVTLKNTGAALSDYAEGEVNDPRPSQFPVQPPVEILQRPPRPKFNSPSSSPPPPPLPRSASMPSKISAPKSELKSEEPIQEGDEEAQIENDNHNSNLIHSARTHQPETLPSSQNDLADLAADYLFSSEMPTSSYDPNDMRPDTYDHLYHNKENASVGDEHVGSNGGVVEPQTPEEVAEQPAVKNPQPSNKLKQGVHSEPTPGEGKRVGKVARSVNLLQIINKLDDHFLKASESARDVSKMLEVNRLHYHSNFADNRGHIDHSAKVMRVITWNRSFKGELHVGDEKDEFDMEENDTHATVLDRLLAWEKKLYDEVKAGELLKLEYQKKVALLNKQKKRGTNSEAMEKTKAAVSHLHTRYIVDMQSLDSTVAEINRLRDDRLYPLLVQLVGGMAEMWETIYIHHVEQLKITQELRLLDLSQASKETTQQHYERTVQLCSVVQEWHAQFQKLVTHQKEHIRALNSWLKQNLIPIESSLKEKVSSPPRVLQPPIQGLVQTWLDNLEKLPDEMAKTPISTFANMVKAVIILQEEEFKQKERVEETRKELARKKRALTELRDKYMQRQTPTNETETQTEKTEDPNYQDPLLMRQFAVEALQKRLEEDEEDHKKYCVHVREMSLQNLKLHLPDLFNALSNFARNCSGMYENLRPVACGELN